LVRRPPTLIFLILISFSVWRGRQESLLRSAEILKVHERSHALLLAEHNFHFLELLHGILCARKEVDRESFKSRFKDESSMERTLRLAMAQGLTVDTPVTRAFHWQYFDYNSLDLPIPDFASAYDFYAAYDAQQLLEPPGYYLVPKGNDAGLEPGWVPVEVRDPATLSLIFAYSFYSQTSIFPISKSTTTRTSAGESEASAFATASARKLAHIATRPRRPLKTTMTTTIRSLS
jgi:hypothetical protein